MNKIKVFLGFCSNFVAKNKNSFLTGIAVSCFALLWVVTVKISHETKLLKINTEKVLLINRLSDYNEDVLRQGEYIRLQDEERVKMKLVLELQQQLIRSLILKLNSLKSPPFDPDKITRSEAIYHETAH